MCMFDELDLEKLEEQLNNSVVDRVSRPAAAPDAGAEEASAAAEEAEEASAMEEMPTADAAEAEETQPAEAAAAPVPAEDAQPKAKGKKDDSAPMSLYDWVQCVVYALVAGILLFVFVGRAINIEGASMYPTLHNGDEVLVSNFLYSPKAGDVVVLRTLTYGPDPLVKRIIATEGQTVDIDFEAGIVYVDGVALDEDYVNAPISFRDDFVGPVTVPEGRIFVLGDNRNESSDSRHEGIGMVDERCIIGRVVCIILPSGGAGGDRDWSRIGKVS